MMSPVIEEEEGEGLLSLPLLKFENSAEMGEITRTIAQVAQLRAGR